MHHQPTEGNATTRVDATALNTIYEKTSSWNVTREFVEAELKQQKVRTLEALVLSGGQLLSNLDVRHLPLIFSSVSMLWRMRQKPTKPSPNLIPNSHWSTRTKL